MLKAAILLIALSLATFAQDVFTWDIPQPFPHPAVPVGNSMSASKVELRRRLFYDQRMSVNGKQSCASCGVVCRCTRSRL